MNPENRGLDPSPAISSCMALNKPLNFLELVSQFSKMGLILPQIQMLSVKALSEEQDRY